MYTARAARAAQNTAIECLEARRHFDTAFANTVDWNDIAYGTDGSVHLAYYDSFSKDLRYAMKPAGGAWGASVLLDSAGDVGQYLSIAVAPNGTVGISYFDATNSSLKYATKSSSTWSVYEVDTVVSLYSSLAFQNNSTPLISYYDGQGDNLKLAQGLSGGSNWTNKYNIDTLGDVGRHTSLAINPSTGRWAIAYESTTGFQVKYAEQSGSSVNTFTTSIVETNSGGSGGFSLAFKQGVASSTPGIAYFDATPANLRYLTRATGVWVGTNVTVSGNVGMNANLGYNPADGRANIVYGDRTRNLTVRAIETSTPNTFTIATIRSGGGRNISAAFGNTADATVNNDSLVFTYNPTPGSTLVVVETAM